MTFTEILKSEKRSELLSRTIETINACRKCEFRQYCKGGCMNHAYEFYQTIYERDYYCQSFFKIFQYINEKVNVSINKAKRQI
jgi:sulfatase maturation enzyme AslB (radical SAM superfamily)